MLSADLPSCSSFDESTLVCFRCHGTPPPPHSMAPWDFYHDSSLGLRGSAVVFLSFLPPLVDFCVHQLFGHLVFLSLFVHRGKLGTPSLSFLIVGSEQMPFLASQEVCLFFFPLSTSHGRAARVTALLLITYLLLFFLYGSRSNSLFLS